VALYQRENCVTLDLPELIEWHEGMLLTPQHFQQFAARSELLAHFMFAQAGAFRWGIVELKIDHAALSGGILRILDIEALMPDGLLALGGVERGLKLEFDLQKAEGNPVRVVLALPREGAVYDRSDYGRYEAFLEKDELTSDRVSGADPATIPRIRPRLRLDAGGARTGSMTVLPLLEFELQGTVCRQTEYIAPMLAVTAGSTLANLCARVGKAVREMATELASKLSPNAAKSDLAGVHQLQWLVSGLPRFEALLESGRAHPYDLYLALCTIAGGVAFLSHARVPPIFPPYDHNDLLASFQRVVGFIRLALSEGLIENWVGKQFTPLQIAGEKRTGEGRQRSEPTYEIGPNLVDAFGAEADFSSAYLGLMIRLPASVSPDSMTEWGESCLLAPEDAIADLELSRSRGAVCERVDFLEDLVVAPASVLFRVRNDTRWIDPHKKLVLKPAKQETSIPDALTLFIKKRTQTNKGA
jgi:type VI secretion system protein ImpJ